MKLIKWFVLLDMLLGLTVYVFFDVEQFIEAYSTYFYATLAVVFIFWKIYQTYKNMKFTQATYIPIQLIEG